jgi:adenylate cyclase
MKPTTPLNALLGRVKAINWSRFTRWRSWRRWFVTSLVQSGRLTVLLALIFIYFLRIDDPNWLQYLRAKTFDIYQQIKPRPFHPDTPVVIADIDEKSIAELGQWQWPRTIFATLVDRLTAMDAKVIAFDVVFAEGDRTSLKAMAVSAAGLDDETRSRLAKMKDNDEVFAEAIKASGRVVLGQPIVSPERTYPEERPKTSFVALGSDPNPNIEQHPGVLRNIDVLDEVSAGHGIFDSSQSFDGIVRVVPMVVLVGGVRYPSLTLETLRLNMGARSIIIKSENDGIKGLLLKQRGQEP